MTATDSDYKLPLHVSPTDSFPVISSIVIHAVVLGLLLPSISKVSEDKTNDPLAKVQVVQLNAVEKTRLPNLSPSTSNEPPVESQSTTSMLNPSLSNNLPAIPNTSNNTLQPLPSLPSLPSLPPLPSNSQSYANYLPPLPLNNNLPMAISPSALPPYQPSYPEQLPSNPPTNYSSRQRPKFEELPPISNPDDLINNRRPSYPISTSKQPTNEQNPQSTELSSQEQWKERLIAQRIAEIERRRESLREDQTNTTDDEAMRNNINWMSKVRSSKPLSIALKGIYPKDACTSKLEGTSVLGMVVDASGRITSTIDIIKSASYPILNQQAITQVQSASFSNSTGSPQAYRVTVNFKYNSTACPSYTDRQLPLLNNSPKPEVIRQVPENSPSVKPEVIPQAPENSPSVKPEAIRQAPENSPSVKPEVIPQVPENSPSVKPEVIPQVPENSPSVKPEAQVSPSSSSSTTEKSDQ